MRADCRGLIDAIDRYIEKADKGLYTELKDDGYAKPKKTVEYITRLVGARSLETSCSLTATSR